ncbi:MAG TPA: GNAT family N-acetyltransferase [Nitrososphaerales archaeon]
MIVISMELKHKVLVVQILKDVNVFNDEEFMVALELIDSYLNGETDYIIKVALDENDLVNGYVCYGRASLADGVIYMYWIAVSPNCQRKGVGKLLLETLEKDAISFGSRMILAETSSTDRYRDSRDFYQSNGFKLTARIENFYRVNDSLLIYRKDLK